MGQRDISIRKFRPEDAKTIAKIINDSLLAKENNDNTEITPKFVLTLSNKRKMYVAINDNLIVGTASIEHDTIHMIFADVQNRNQGVEEALVSLLEEIAANNGFMHIKLETRNSEVKLYERLGYSTTAEVLTNELGKHVLMERYLV